MKNAVILPLAAAAALTTPGFVPPYLQAGTTTSMEVIWVDRSATTAELRVTDAGGRAVADVHDAAQRRHVMHVTGLTAGTTYRYTALSDGKAVGTSSFHTNNAPGQTDFRFAVVGDSGSGNEHQLAVATQMLKWKPDFVLHTGDVVYEDGTTQDYQPNFVKPYWKMTEDTVVYPTLGNHDYRTEKGAPYLAFFDPPRANPAASERWYTFSYGDIDFFALDSNAKPGPGSAEYEWLKGALAASRARWKMAFFHHPFYSSGWEGSSPWLRGPWEPLFQQYGVNVVFNGHDHDYERIKPQHGIQYVVTGGGGAWLRNLKVSSFTAAEKKTWHFVGVHMHGDRLEGEAIDDHGAVFDRWSVQR